MMLGKERKEILDILKEADNVQEGGGVHITGDHNIINVGSGSLKIEAPKKESP